MSAPLTDNQTEDYRRQARELYTGHGGGFNDGDIDVDVDAVVSHSDEGAYVAAWVWVPKQETPAPGLVALSDAPDGWDGSRPLQ